MGNSRPPEQRANPGLDWGAAPDARIITPVQEPEGAQAKGVCPQGRSAALSAHQAGRADDPGRCKHSARKTRFKRERPLATRAAKPAFTTGALNTIAPGSSRRARQENARPLEIVAYPDAAAKQRTGSMMPGVRHGKRRAGKTVRKLHLRDDTIPPKIAPPRRSGGQTNVTQASDRYRW